MGVKLSIFIALFVLFNFLVSFDLKTTLDGSHLFWQLLLRPTYCWQLLQAGLLPKPKSGCTNFKFVGFSRPLRPPFYNPDNNTDCKIIHNGYFWFSLELLSLLWLSLSCSSLSWMWLFSSTYSSSSSAQPQGKIR